MSYNWSGLILPVLQSRHFPVNELYTTTVVQLQTFKKTALKLRTNKDDYYGIYTEIIISPNSSLCGFISCKHFDEVRGICELLKGGFPL